MNELGAVERGLQETVAFMTALLESVGEAVIACDSDGHLTLFNRAARRLHGASEAPVGPDEWAGRYDLYRADGTTPLPVDEIPLSRALGGEHVHDAEMVVAPSGMPTRTMLVNGSPIIDDSGRRHGAVVSMRDVTAAREAEAARREVAVEQTARRIAEQAAGRLAAVLDQMPAGVMVTEASGALVTGNRRVAEILGRQIPAGAVPGDVFAGVAFRPDGDPMRPADWPIARALATGDVVGHEEIVLAPPDGPTRTILASAAPIRDAGGNVVAGVVTVQDVTARAAAGERLRHLQELGAALSGALSPAEVAEVAASHAMAASGATRALVARVDRPNRMLELLHQSGFSSDATDRFAQQPLTASLPLAEVLRRGEALWLEGDAESARELDSAALCPEPDAMAVLPLVIDDAVIGCVALCFPHADPFDRDLRLLLLTVAGLCAEALERAGRWEQERDAARLLQRSLLPTALPVDAEFSLATRYLPAAGGLAGGDFYDAVALGDGRLALVVGDVVGHGIAAAAIMGQLRSAWRSIALDDRGTVDTLRRLSRFAATVPLAEVATAVCAVVAPDGQVSYACAGHPPPLRTGGPQGPMYLMDGRGPPLATGVDRYLEGQAMLAPGESLVLYTDGVIDRRGTSLEDGMANLVRAVAERGGSHDGALLDHLVDRLCQAPQDDCAFLAVRRRDQPRTG